jgi:hypothetical protein
MKGQTLKENYKNQCRAIANVVMNMRVP